MLTLAPSALPEKLSSIPKPPKHLYSLGSDIKALASMPGVAIVGSRRVSPYGRHVTEKIAGELAESGVVIVSGLALGVDSIAHRAALDAGGLTVAVLPGGIKRAYPRSHEPLARLILQNGGSLISERNGIESPRKEDFLIRNRLVSGLSDAVLITEAAIRSGSLNTARHALEQGRVVMAVPGNITSDLSAGTNNLIRMGAVPITSAADVFEAMNWQIPQKKTNTFVFTPQEKAIIETLKKSGSISAEELRLLSGLKEADFSETMTMLEINAVITPLGANIWTLK